MQVAQWFERPQALQAGRKHNDEADEHLENTVVDKSCDQRKKRHILLLGTARSQPTIENEQQNHRGKYAQPLMPLPSARKIEIARRGCLAPGIACRFEKPSQRNQKPCV